MRPYERVKYVRSLNRPTGLDYIKSIFKGFIEFHGDRCCGDDQAIVGGIGWLKNMPVTIIAIERGKNIEERIKCHFGCPNPEGYRKAKRLMEQAEKFHRPIICFIDTMGAYCDVKSEEHGQGQAISECIKKMINIRTPVITVIVGEGGSGGALALSVSDEVWMLENSVYSVITPESCSNILWKTDNKADEAAEYLKLTAEDAFDLGIIQKVIKESDDIKTVYNDLQEQLYDSFKLLKLTTTDLIVASRYNRFRKYGA